jgi:hypothetical protein
MTPTTTISTTKSALLGPYILLSILGRFAAVGGLGLDEAAEPAAAFYGTSARASQQAVDVRSSVWGSWSSSAISSVLRKRGSRSLGALVAVFGHAIPWSSANSERRAIRRSLSCACGERLLMRSLALEIDSIVRGKLRQVTAGYFRSRQFAARSGNLRLYPANLLMSGAFRRKPAMSGIAAAMSRTLEGTPISR